MGKVKIRMLIVLAILIIGQIDKIATKDSLLQDLVLRDGLPSISDYDFQSVKKNHIPQNFTLYSPMEDDDDDYDYEENAMGRGLLDKAKGKLPDIKKMVEKKMGLKIENNGTKFSYKGCVVDMSQGDNYYVLDMSDETCQGTASLGKLAEYLLKKVDKKDKDEDEADKRGKKDDKKEDKGGWKKSAVKFIKMLDKFNADRIEVNTTSGDVLFKAHLKESWTIYKTLKIKKANINLDFNYMEAFDYSRTGFVIDGETQLGSTTVGLKMEKESYQNLTDFDLIIDTIKLGEIMETFNKKDDLEDDVEVDLTEEDEADQGDEDDAETVQGLGTPAKRGIKGDEDEEEDDDTSEDAGSGGAKGGIKKKIKAFFSKIEIQNIKFNGTFDIFRGNADLLVTGTVKGIPHINGAQIFSTIQVKEDFCSPHVGVLLKVDSVYPVRIIKGLLGTVSKTIKKYMDKIPVINDIKTDLVLEYANANMGVPSTDEMKEMLAEIGVNQTEITEGTKIKLTFPLEEIVEINELNVAEGTNLSPYIVIHIQGSTFRFEFPDEVLMDLANFFVAFVPNFSKWAIKKIFPSAEIRIPQFLVDVKTKQVDLKLEVAHLFKIGNGFLELEQVEFELHHSAENDTHKQPWLFRVRSVLKIGDGTMDIVIEKPDEDTFLLTGTIDMISTADLLGKFAPGSYVQDVMNKMAVFNFGIKDVELKYKWGAAENVQGKKKSTHDLRVKGQILFATIWSASLEVFIQSNADGEKIFGMGFMLTNVGMNDLACEMFQRNGKEIKTVDSHLLSQVTISIMIGNSGDLKFERDDLQKILDDRKTDPLAEKFDKGVLFQADLLIPEGCSGDSICCFVKKHIGAGQHLKVVGMADYTRFYLQIMFEGRIAMSKKVVLTKAYLEATISVAPKIGISAKCEIQPKGQDEPLSLSAKLTASLTGMIEISFAMEGEWENAFGYKFLRVSNFHMSVGFNPLTFNPKFTLGGALKIGYEPKPMEIILLGGFNLPSFYVYIEFNELTLSGMFEAFGKADSLTVPQALAKSGFPNGLKFGVSVPNSFEQTLNMSRTRNGKKEWYEKKVKIPAGFSFEGTLKILGFELFMHLEIDLPTRFYLKACMKGFNFGGGMLALQGWKDKDTGVVEDGPVLEVEIGKDGFYLKISGELSVLKMSLATLIEISDEGFLFKIEGDFWGMFTVSVYFQATYGKDGEAMEEGGSTRGWMFGFCVEAGEVEEIKKEAISGVKTAKAEVEQANNEEAKARQEPWWFRQIRKLVDFGKDTILRKQGKLDVLIKKWADRAISRKDPESYPGCLKRCRDEEMVYVGGVNMVKCEVGAWELWYPQWDSQRSYRQDPHCVAKCFDYGFWRQGKKEASGLRDKGKILKKTAQIWTIAQGVKVLNWVTPYLDKLGTVLKAAWQGFKDILAKGAKMLASIKNFIIDKLLYIESFCMNTTLGSWKDGMKINFRAHLWIGGKSGKEINIPDTQIELSWDYIKQWAWETAKKAFPGIEKIWGKVKEIKEETKNSGIWAKIKSGLSKVGIHIGDDDKRSGIPHATLPDWMQAQDTEEFVDNLPDNICDLFPTTDEKKKCKKEKIQDVGDIKDPRIIKAIHDNEANDDFTVRNDEGVSAFRSIFRPFAQEQQEDNAVARGKCAKETGAYVDADTSTDTDDKTLCGGLKKATKVYGGATDTLKFLVEKSDITKAEYETFIQEYSRRNNEREAKYLEDLAQIEDLDEEDRENAMYYINQFKEGMEKWRAQWDQEQDDAERKALKTWSSYFGKLDTKTLKKILDTTANVAVKRNELPKESHNKLQQSLKSAEKNLEHLTQDDGATLSSKKSHINSLIKDVEKMKELTKGQKCQ